VILALENGQLVIEMRGDLAAMLAFSANKKRSPQYVATCYSRPRRRRFTRAAGSPAATPPEQKTTIDQRAVTHHEPPGGALAGDRQLRRRWFPHIMTPHSEGADVKRLDAT
jgi:hypothetical protein